MPQARELDTETVVASKFFVDSRESTLNESGDYILAAKEGAIGPDHIQAEIGEVLLGKHPGRSSDRGITVFKALGLAAEDLAAAECLFHQASDRHVGTWVEF